MPDEGEFEQRLDRYARYDEYSDIVSSLQWLFTCTTELQSVVAHFERFPKFVVDDRKVTPDFTVLFHNGNAIVGEIATLALHEGSVQSLAKQVDSYLRAAQVPVGTGGRTAQVQSVGVLLLMPLNAASNTVDRLILQPEHGKTFAQPPCIAAYAREGDRRYNYNRIRHPGNGTLPDNGSAADLTRYLDANLSIAITNFASLKAEYPFTNDPVDDLYLATHLYTRTWPTMYGEELQQGEVRVDIDATHTALRIQNPRIQKADIRRALGLLKDAGRAKNRDGGWDVRFGQMRSRTHGSEVHLVLAERASRTTAASKKKQAPPDSHPTLFDP